MLQCADLNWIDENGLHREIFRRNFSFMDDQTQLAILEAALLADVIGIGPFIASGEDRCEEKCDGCRSFHYQPTALRSPCLVMFFSSSQTARPLLVWVRLSWKV